MDFQIGDSIYYIREGVFRKTVGRCPHCGGKGLIRGGIKEYKQLRVVCPHCLGRGELEHREDGQFIMGPNVIVNMADKNVVVSSEAMLRDMKRLNMGMKDAFAKLATKYSWERVGKDEAFRNKEDAIKAIEAMDGVLAGGM